MGFSAERLELTNTCHYDIIMSSLGLSMQDLPGAILPLIDVIICSNPFAPNLSEKLPRLSLVFITSEDMPKYRDCADSLQSTKQLIMRTVKRHVAKYITQI